MAELFPVLFFLTAVPWPPRFEQPITAGLMQAVAAATAGLLHWFGIPAQTAGGAITLRTGVVGITEACSGMRSLQAGIMFGLAMGEWFLLRPQRRIVLLLIAIALALCTNLVRTLVLSLQAEWNGLSAVEKLHDFTGRLAVSARVRLPRDVWNELHPTSGEYIRVRNSRLGAGEVFHFFWKPSPWNRFVLVHRPDICMPGVGWESSGSPESITIDFSGHQTQLYLFRFRRGDVEVLELWGVWRNGDAVALDYQPDQVLGVAAVPPALHLEGKRRSATEVVACVVGGNRDHPPDADRAITILKSVFQYNSSRE